jgi:hypothetical protein
MRALGSVGLSLSHERTIQRIFVSGSNVYFYCPAVRQLVIPSIACVPCITALSADILSAVRWRVYTNWRKHTRGWMGVADAFAVVTGIYISSTPSSRHSFTSFAGDKVARYMYQRKLYMPMRSGSRVDHFGFWCPDSEIRLRSSRVVTAEVAVSISSSRASSPMPRALSTILPTAQSRYPALDASHCLLLGSARGGGGSADGSDWRAS